MLHPFAVTRNTERVDLRAQTGCKMSGKKVSGTQAKLPSSAREELARASSAPEPARDPDDDRPLFGIVYYCYACGKERGLVGAEGCTCFGDE